MESGEAEVRNNMTAIELFQDLLVSSETLSCDELLTSIRKHTRVPWLEASVDKSAVPDGIVRFDRERGADLSAARLTLWRQPNGYKVVNILPSEKVSLTVSEYNAVLSDFCESIILPASLEAGFEYEISEKFQSLTDWTSEEAARALHIFSNLANKSTGSSHPSDKERWLKFLLVVFNAPNRPDPSLLERWLIEAEHWPSEVATDLTIQYEFGMALLEKYVG